ncbi:uncharacterized protein VTP21DRAFT_7545 [Calcarisporiella thermophila]|uniref:uncharacterized protein n=1 Tax=Calcarisporiella thermophila TaxID=911321 RepID=UPI0037426F87
MSSLRLSALALFPPVNLLNQKPHLHAPEYPQWGPKLAEKMPLNPTKSASHSDSTCRAADRSGRSSHAQVLPRHMQGLMRCRDEKIAKHGPEQPCASKGALKCKFIPSKLMDNCHA